MNGFDYQKLKMVEKKAASLGFEFDVYGNSFILKDKNKSALGSFPDINEISVYLNGYEVGKMHGRCEQSPIEQ